MIDAVHRRHHRQQHLRRADIGGGLFAPDVLLACLQRQAVGVAAPAVDADADQTAGQRPLIGRFGRDIGRVRAAVSHRHAEPLRRAERNVGAELSRRHQQSQRQRIGSHDGDSAVSMQAFDPFAVVDDASRRTGILKQGAEYRGRIEIGWVADDDSKAQRLGPGRHDCNRLRMAIAIDEEAVRARLRHPPRHGHGLGGGGCFVEQRGVGDLEPRQIDDHGLKIQQGFEPALADLRLIRRIGRVPRRVFQHVALDDGGQMRAVIALADQRGHRAVARCHVAQLRQQFRLRQRRTEIERLRLADIAGDGLVDQGVERRRSDHPQHALDVVRRRTQMPVAELPRIE